MEFGGSAEWIPVQEMNRRLRAAEAEAHTHGDGNGEGGGAGKKGEGTGKENGNGVVEGNSIESGFLGGEGSVNTGL